MSDFFKAKAIGSGQWVTGMYLPTMFCGKMRHLILQAKPLAVEMGKGSENVFMDCEKQEVDPGTVRRHTGLYDVNGVGIFDGDFLKHYSDPSNRDNYEFGLAYWSVADSAFYLLSENSKNMEKLWNIEKYEIVGNVDDNPEMSDRIVLDSDGKVRKQLIARFIRILDTYQPDFEEMSSFLYFLFLLHDFSVLAEKTDIYRDTKEEISILAKDHSPDECINKMLKMCCESDYDTCIEAPIVMVPIILEKLRETL